MQRDSSAMWVYAVAAMLLATVAVARCAPDPERVNTAVLDASRPIADPIPYEGWWKEPLVVSQPDQPDDQPKE